MKMGYMQGPAADHDDSPRSGCAAKMLLLVWLKISWNQGSLMLWMSGLFSVTGRGTNLPAHGNRAGHLCVLTPATDGSGQPVLKGSANT